MQTTIQKIYVCISKYKLMETTSQNSVFLSDKNAHTNAVFVHLSGFIKFAFPLLFIIAPILIWTRNKENSFIDHHGRQAINFHMSMMIYSIILVVLCVVLIVFFFTDLITFIELIDKQTDSINSYIIWTPWMIWLLVLTIFMTVKFFFEIVVMLIATIRASDGKTYRYPLTISFLKNKKLQQ